MLRQLDPDLACTPWSFAEQSLFRSIPFDQILHFAEQHFHEIRLRANPSAEQTAESCREKNDEHDEGDHRYPEDEEILRPEDLPENDEFGIGDVEHEKRPFMPLEEWQGEKKEKETETQQCTNVVESPFGFLSEHPFSFSFFIDRCQMIPE